MSRIELLPGVSNARLAAQVVVQKLLLRVRHLLAYCGPLLYGESR